MRTSHQTLTNSHSTAARVEHLDDATLRSGHALLNQTRSRDFSRWMDQQLGRLEEQFRDYAINRSLRQSMGR